MESCAVAAQSERVLPKATSSSKPTIIFPSNKHSAGKTALWNNPCLRQEKHSTKMTQYDFHPLYECAAFYGVPSVRRKVDADVN